MTIKFEDNSAILAAKLEIALGSAIKEIGGVGETMAKRRTPVDEGNLRAHVSHDVDTRKKEAKIGVLSGHSNKAGSKYAGYVEFGTSRQAAQPYIRPTVDDMKKNADEIVTRHIRKIGV